MLVLIIISILLSLFLTLQKYRMHEVSLPMLRLMELTSVVDSLSMQQIGSTIKDIRLATKMVEDLKAVCKPYAEKSDVFNRKQAELIKPYQDEFMMKKESLSDQELKALEADVNARFAKESEEKYGEERKAIEEEGKQVVKVELSDEKFTKLKELFEKYAAEKYLRKDVLVEVADALGIE